MTKNSVLIPVLVTLVKQIFILSAMKRVQMKIPAREKNVSQMKHVTSQKFQYGVVMLKGASIDLVN